MSETNPRTLLFLSCDLVGSTQFKQQTPLWQEAFLSFYRDYPQILGDLTLESEYAPGFRLWKAIGDELIFTSHVQSELDVFHATRLWLEAMQRYEDSALARIGMRTKGGAFAATFPGPDSESSIPRDPRIETSERGVVERNFEALESRSTKYLYDYFGPSIDTGFRVISACSNRYFTLSIEVAWCLARVAQEDGVSTLHSIADLRLLEPREFKGVWGGREYPVFAFDRHYSDPVNVALSQIREDEIAPHHVVNLCKECAAKADWPSRLYLPKSSFEPFRIAPTDSLEPLRANRMVGAESLPPDTPAGESLTADAPLGDDSAVAVLQTND